tara:strand:- start:1478 stop:1693 length:216 start_codon:yes stop_codon:yes gene_type:complete
LYEHGDDIPFEVNLMVDPDSRTWRLEATGSAATLLFFILDSSEQGLASKLFEEAKFDKMVRYDLGELNEPT